MANPRNISQANDYAHSLSTAKPCANNNDLTFLRNVIGDANVVGLGEVTHGISECFQLKHRLLDYLVREMGFSIFSIEANMPEAYCINDYVLNGSGDLRKLIEEMRFWTWNTQEVFEMIEWMRIYNKTTDKKVQFTGFDSQSINLPADIVKNNFANEAVSETINQIINIINHLQSHYNNCEFTQPEIDAIVSSMLKDEQYQELNTKMIFLEQYLLANKVKLMSQLGEQKFAWTERNLAILKSSCAGLVDPLATRDRMMAENVLWIQDQNPGAKIILWAHNGHIHKQGFASTTYPPMGHYLKAKLKDKYRSIGFVAYGGSYAAKDWSDGFILKRDLKLHTPPSNSLEAKLKVLFDNKKNSDVQITSEPILFLDLQHPNKPDWLSKPISARLGVGSTKEGDRVEYSFSEYDISAGYDGIIYLETVHASQPIKQLNHNKLSEDAFPKLSLFKPVETPPVTLDKPLLSNENTVHQQKK